MVRNICIFKKEKEILRKCEDIDRRGWRIIICVGGRIKLYINTENERRYWEGWYECHVFYKSKHEAKRMALQK